MAVHADGGAEFKRANKFLQGQGIEFTISTTYTPQPIGLAESSHRTILELDLTCLLDANLILKYCSYAVKHVIPCQNNVPHGTTGRVPYKCVFDRLSSETVHLHLVAGCALYELVKTPRRTFKLCLKKGIKLGHLGRDIYSVLTESGVQRTKHVRMLETVLPGTIKTTYDQQNEKMRKLKGQEPSLQDHHRNQATNQTRPQQIVGQKAPRQTYKDS